MTARTILTALGGSLVVAAVAGASGALWAAEEVGITAVTNPGVTGTPPDAPSRTLLVGDRVVFQEVIETDPNGQTQVLFLDQSTLTVGPDSYVIIDEFVYDPATAEGSFRMTLEQGLVRFVGGKISKTAGVSIETQTATLGIRGGMAIVQELADGKTRGINLFGKLSADPKQIANRTCDAGYIADDPGDYVTIEGCQIADVGQVDANELGIIYAQFQGGATDISNDTVEEQIAQKEGTEPSAQTEPIGLGEGLDDVAGYEVVVDGQQQARLDDIRNDDGSIPVSGRYVATPDAYDTAFGGSFTEPLAQNALGGPDGTYNRGFDEASFRQGAPLEIDTDGDGEADLVLPTAEGTFAVSAGASESPLGPLSGTGTVETLEDGTPFFLYDLSTEDEARRVRVFGGVPTPADVIDPGMFEVRSYALSPDPVILSDLPFATPEIAEAFPSFQATEFMVVTRRNSGLEDANSLWMAISIEGEGPGQNSLIEMSVGPIAATNLDDERTWRSLRGSYTTEGGAPESIGRITGSVFPQADSGGNVYFGFDADRLVLSNSGAFQLDPESGTVDLEANQDVLRTDGYGNSIETEIYGFTHLASQTDNAPGVGSRRGDKSWQGYASGVGVSRLRSGEIGDIYTLQTASASDLTIETDSSNSSFLAALALEASPVLAGRRAPEYARWAFGGNDNSRRSTYADTTYFAARQAIPEQIDEGGFGEYLEGEVPVELSPQVVGFDGDIGQGGGFTSYFLNGKPFDLAEYFPDTQFCECNFLQWGFWGGEYRWDNSGENPGRRERVHLGTWVAGEIPEASEIAGLNGTVSHAGHVFGTVVLGDGSQYFETGNYNQSFNFGTDTGTFEIGDFDGRDYTGGELGVGSGTAGFTTTSPATSGFGGEEHYGLSATVEGSFFKGGSGPVDYAGGTFRITGSPEGSFGEGSVYDASGSFAAQRQER